MRDPVVTLAATPSAGDVLTRFFAPIAAAWPAAGGTPQPRTVDIKTLLEEMDPRQRGAERPGPLLVVLGPDEPDTLVLQLADQIQRRLLPAVILFPNADAERRRLQSGGIIVDSWDAAPAFLAAVLYTLDQRQATVRTLASEIQIAARFQGGVRGEMDRIHDELSLAATVQQEMLPKKLPTLAGIDCAVLFRPAGYVSGDIYDAVELDQHHLAFFIADAVGHGVPAALMTMVISGGLRMTRGGAEIVRPGDAMTRLNEELLRGNRQRPRFATAVYGHIDVRTREVTLTGAGHPPPLIIRNGQMRRVETEGALLGIFPGEKYGDVKFTLEPDETLLLYSDGFETAFDRAEAPGEKKPPKSSDEYLKHLAALDWPGTPAGSLAAALEQLGSRLDSQAGSLHQIDDLTALAIAPAPIAAATPAPMAAAA